MAEIDERAERIVRRALGPKEQILEYLTTHDYNSSIKKHDEFVDYMVNHPVEVYTSMKER